jgi:D-glycero-D-manno-heptose 1,7-bisphosphate phosphatase
VKPREHEYLVTPDEFVWLPHAPEALARLARSGYVLAVVSNQRGVARGLLTPGTVREIEQRIQSDLASYECAIAAFRYCFHDYGDDCECRKPKPGMILQLASDLDLDLGSSWMVGDSESDITAGAAAGCRTALVGDAGVHGSADLLAPSLWEVSDLLARRPSACF